MLRWLSTLYGSHILGQYVYNGIYIYILPRTTQIRGTNCWPVCPAPPAPPACACAGQPYTLTAIAFDDWGNFQYDASPGFTLDPATASLAANLTTSDPGNGLSLFSYTLTAAGPHTITVLTASGAVVHRGAVHVVPGPVDPPASSVVPSATQLQAGGALVCEVSVRDAFGNAVVDAAAAAVTAVLTFEGPEGPGEPLVAASVPFTPPTAAAAGTRLFADVQAGEGSAGGVFT